MVKIITIEDVKTLVNTVGLLELLREVTQQIEEHYQRWESFYRAPRHAIHNKHGVYELMPTADEALYSVKYVNGHPRNPQFNKLTVAAVGMLAEIEFGYPLMFCEMTLLTALRTAATSALVSRYLARNNAKRMGIIGTGSQGEFQVLAHLATLGVNDIKYFDIDPAAMEKFASNLADYDVQLTPCSSAEETVTDVDIITTATADKQRLKILHDEWIKPGMHINGVGGDCPGKTELSEPTLHRAKIVVEFLEQTLIEGEIQNMHADDVYAELWELASGTKPGRENDDEVTLFDSVGFAIEDHAVLSVIYRHAQRLNLGHELPMIPVIDDPKNLFGVLK